MEITTESLSYFTRLPRPPQPPSTCSTSSLSQSFFHSRVSLLAHNSVNFLGFNCLQRKLQCGARQLRNFGVVSASDAKSSSTDGAERWLLEPIGDGDFRHIGFKVEMPSAFEIASDVVVTVGRVAEKADLVIPVATVSALHARIQKKEGTLLVTDLDSTNGTFIDNKRLRPGVVAAAPPGSCITFGDVHLAIFRVSKLENQDVVDKPEDSEAKSGTEDSSKI